MDSALNYTEAKDYINKVQNPLFKRSDVHGLFFNGKALMKEFKLPFEIFIHLAQYVTKTETVLETRVLYDKHQKIAAFKLYLNTSNSLRQKYEYFKKQDSLKQKIANKFSSLFGQTHVLDSVMTKEMYQQKEIELQNNYHKRRAQ